MVLHGTGRFTVADYLLQHLTTQRRSVRLPGLTWQALTYHIHDHDDLHARARLHQRLRCDGSLRGGVHLHGDRGRRPGTQDHQNRSAALGHAVR